MSNTKKYIAEALGTMFLVLMGCGSAVLAGSYIHNVGISLAFGLTVLVMVYAIGPISGCHINPAITIAMWFNKKIKANEALWYILAQFAGAIIGAFIVYGIAAGTASYGGALGTNGYGDFSPAGYSMLSAAMAEIILTALFLFVIFGATSKKAPEGFAGVAIGLTLVIIHIVGIPVTGVSVNPARSFGPALVSLATGGGAPFCQVWLFLVMPVIGGILGALLWNSVDSKK